MAGLDHYLSLNYVPGPHTLVEGIEKLAAGALAGMARRSRVDRRLLAAGVPSGSRLDLESAKEELDRLLRSAVREHLVSDVPLGVWSSGGLDSTTILHYAAEASPAQAQDVFGFVPAGAASMRARTFARWRDVYGTDHHEFDLNPEVEIQSALEQFAFYSDEPSADAGALPVWFLSKMCRSEVTVALSGDGADELFGGYNTYLADRLCAQAARLSACRCATPLRGMTRLLPVSDEKIGLDYKITRMLQGRCCSIRWTRTCSGTGLFGKDEKASWPSWVRRASAAGVAG